LLRKVAFRTNKANSVKDCKKKSHSEQTKQNLSEIAKKSHIPNTQNKIRQGLQRKSHSEQKKKQNPPGIIPDGFGIVCSKCDFSLQSLTDCVLFVRNVTFHCNP
jgi:hypothetical protein